MQSKKFKYRVVTAREGGFRVQFHCVRSSEDGYTEKGWENIGDLFDTVAAAIAWIERNIEEDNYTPEVVAI